MIIIDLIYNLAILISISILAGFIENRWKKTSLLGSSLQGLLFGAAVIIGMLNPFVFAPGIIFDGRSVLLSLCGLFFGPVAASIAAVIAIICRTMIGGSGVYMGVSVIVASSLIGIGAYYYRYRNNMKPNSLFLYIVGILVHAVMLFLMLLLPSAIREETARTITFTVLGIYPLAEILIGKILYDQEERALLMKEIIQNEKDSTTTLMSIGDAVIATDLKGNITRMNKMAELLTGWDFNEVKGNPINTVFKIYSDEPRNSLTDPVINVLENKKLSSISENTILINRYQHEYHISDSAAPILDEKGKIQGVILVFSNITGKYTIEKELARERNLLRTLIDSLPFSIYIKDKNFRKLLVNKTELEFVKRTNEEVIGKADDELFPPDLAAKFMDDDRQVIEKGIPVRDKKEFLPLTADRKRWISTNKIPWKDDKGNIIGLVGFGIDISDKIEDEEKIRKLSEAMLQSPTAIIITDRDGRIEHTNPRFEEMTGYNDKDVHGKVARILKGKNILENTTKEIWDTLLSGKKWRGEYYSKRKSDEYYWESVIISPIFNDQNQITNFILLIEDITERKKLITELIETKEKAIESDNLKSAFLANMSHEIRTPMNGILGFTELLRSPDLNFDDQQLYLSIIEQSGQRLLKLINDIIDISKIEAGQLTLSIDTVNINQLIEMEYHFFIAEAENKGLTLTCLKGLDDDHALIKTDQDRLSQVLTNLIKNSLKFTPDGTISFGYALNNNLLEFWVSDDGIGISDEMREKIFERFHQGDLVLNRRYDGAGLGLSISQGLIEMLGGNIWVESKEKGGSIFKFTIPYIR
jgi:PAS domain S-box-containing protein